MRERLPHRQRRKISKSRGTFITAHSYITQNFNPEWLRYYFAGKSNGTMEDVNLNLDDMIAKVNSDLVGKFVNIARPLRRLHRQALRGQAGRIRRKLRAGLQAAVALGIQDHRPCL